MSCLLRRALQTHHVNVTHWLLSCLNLTFGILPRMGETSCQGFAEFEIWWTPNFPILLVTCCCSLQGLIIQVLDLHQTRAWHWKHRHVSWKTVSKCGPKKPSLLPQRNGPVPTAVPLQTVYVLFAQKSTPNSSCKCDTLAFVLSQLNLWHPPKNGGNILPRLCRVWNLMAAKHSYTVCDLLLKLTIGIGLASNKSLALKTLTCILKSGLQMRTKKA